MRLIAFGCSHTYGVGLEDCWIEEGGPGDLPPSKLAWPQLMANKLGIQCVNASKWGSSNREIWHRITNFEFEKDDLIIAQWTYANRDCIIKEDNIEQLATWHNEDYVKKYITMTYNAHDKAILANTYIHHANMLVPNIHNFSTDIRELYPMPKWQNTDILFDMNTIYIDSNKSKLDNEHGDEQFHMDLANKYLEIVSHSKIKKSY